MYLHLDPFGFGPSGAPRYGPGSTSPVSSQPAGRAAFVASNTVTSAFPNPSTPMSSSNLSVNVAPGSSHDAPHTCISSIHSALPFGSSAVGPSAPGGSYWAGSGGPYAAAHPISLSHVHAHSSSHPEPFLSHGARSASQPPPPALPLASGLSHLAAAGAIGAASVNSASGGGAAPLFQPAADIQAWCTATLRDVERRKQESASQYLAAVEAAVDEYLQTVLGLARPDEVIPHDYLDVRPVDMAPIAANIELLQHCAQDAFLPSSGFRRNLVGPVVQTIWHDYLNPLRQMLVRVLADVDVHRAAGVNVVSAQQSGASLLMPPPPPPISTTALPYASSHSNLFSNGIAPPAGSGVVAAAPSPIYLAGHPANAPLANAPIGATAAAVRPGAPTTIAPMEKLVRSVRLDIQHLDDMWKLECAWPGDESAPQQRELSHIVPVAGLLLGRVHRLLNEHQTVIEHWGR